MCTFQYSYLRINIDYRSRWQRHNRENCLPSRYRDGRNVNYAWRVRLARITEVAFKMISILYNNTIIVDRWGMIYRNDNTFITDCINSRRQSSTYLHSFDSTCTSAVGSTRTAYLSGFKIAHVQRFKLYYDGWAS